MGGQKGETHDEEAITNKLKANGEASIFFFLKKKKVNCLTVVEFKMCMMECF